MTFSIVGRCGRTGMLGIGIATNAIAVGARCPFVRPGVGAIATQATTDPRLGPAGLDRLEAGHSADTVSCRASVMWRRSWVNRLKRGSDIALICPNERTLDRVEKIVESFHHGPVRT